MVRGRSRLFRVFVHFASALHFGWKGPAGRLKTIMPRFLVVIGVITALTIILAISGLFYDVPVIEDVLEYYRKYFPFV